MNNQIRYVGQNKTRLASVGIGAMSFSNFYGPCNDEQADPFFLRQLIWVSMHRYIKCLWNGVSEQRIGGFLAKQGRMANDFFHIATKAGICRDLDTGARLQ